MERWLLQYVFTFESQLTVHVCNMLTTTHQRSSVKNLILTIIISYNLIGPSPGLTFSSAIVMLSVEWVPTSVATTL